MYYLRKFGILSALLLAFTSCVDEQKAILKGFNEGKTLFVFNVTVEQKHYKTKIGFSEKNSGPEFYRETRLLVFMEQLGEDFPLITERFDLKRKSPNSSTLVGTAYLYINNQSEEQQELLKDLWRNFSKKDERLRLGQSHVFKLQDINTGFISKKMFPTWLPDIEGEITHDDIKFDAHLEVPLTLFN